MDTAREKLARQAARLSTRAGRMSLAARQLAEDASSVLPPTEGKRVSSAIRQIGDAVRETQFELDRIRETLRRLSTTQAPSGQLSAEEIRALFPPSQGLPAVLVQQEAQLKERSANTARANSAMFQQMNIAPILAALEQQRRGAAKMARALLREQPQLKGLPRGQRPAVLRSLEILAGELRDPSAVLEWLNKQLPDLDMQRPIEVIRSGRADVIEHMLSDALKGIPS